MSRAGYCDDGDEWALIRWRGAVNSAIKGKRGQKFLREMAQSLDAMPEKKLIKEELMTIEGVCALGAVAVSRNIDVTNIESYENHDQLSTIFGIAPAMIREIEYINDEHGWGDIGTERRWFLVRGWVDEQIEIKAHDPSH